MNQRTFLKICSITKLISFDSVFYSVLNDMSQHEFPFPCNKHAVHVLAHVNFYLQYQMRQFVKTITADLKKANQEKKKMPKLIAT